MARRSEPAPTVARPRWLCAAGRVITLMTPFTALAPHSAALGPRMTSIRSMSSSSVSCTSQKTPPNADE
jgi:hypothetical protein